MAGSGSNGSSAGKSRRHLSAQLCVAEKEQKGLPEASAARDAYMQCGIGAIVGQRKLVEGEVNHELQCRANSDLLYLKVPYLKYLTLP